MKKRDLSALFDRLTERAIEKAGERLVRAGSTWDSPYYEARIDLDQIKERWYWIAEHYPNICIAIISNFLVRRHNYYFSPKHYEDLNKMILTAKFQ